MTESTGQPDESLARALDAASNALRSHPTGLITDFDGTLSPIVADPGQARLADGAQPALAALVQRLAVVAIITGRAALDARRMTGLGGLLIAGNHGTEWLEPDADEPAPAVEAASVRGRLDAVLSELPYLAGVTIEHKGLSATVHYRNAADPTAALTAILQTLDSVAVRGLQLRRGRMSVELRPVGLGDKGSAARAVVERFGLGGVVIMGDDVTDLDMFRAVAELRARGAVRAAIVGVGAADSEMRPEVLAAADVTLADPTEAVRFLAGLSAAAPPADGG